MQFSNRIKKKYIEEKKRFRRIFPEAYDFLTQLENLSDRGFHIGAPYSLNLYYKTKLVLHVGINTGSDNLDIRERSNGPLKTGTTDDSKSFFEYFLPKLAHFRTDKSNTLEIFDDDTISVYVNKTNKSGAFFRLLLDSILEYVNKDDLPDLSDELDKLVNEQQIYIDLNNPSNEKLLEGIQKTITATIYERNLKARAECLKHWQYSCVVCGFNFEKTYGEIGKNYIHVHHINQISSIKKEYEVDPIQDLRPVCPNCHSMIHRNKEPLSIEELKSLLAKTKGNGY